MRDLQQHALTAALAIDDVYCQSHQRRSQRTKRVQAIIITAIQQWLELQRATHRLSAVVQSSNVDMVQASPQSSAAGGSHHGGN